MSVHSGTSGPLSIVADCRSRLVPLLLTSSGDNRRFVQQLVNLLPPLTCRLIAKIGQRTCQLEMQWLGSGLQEGALQNAPTVYVLSAPGLQVLSHLTPGTRFGTHF